MKKLKPKYKWADRRRHFLVIKQDNELAQCLMDNIGKYPFYWLIYLTNIRNMLPISDGVLEEIKTRIKNYNRQARLSPFNRLNPNYKNMHWTPEELEKIKET